MGNGTWGRRAGHPPLILELCQAPPDIIYRHLKELVGQLGRPGLQQFLQVWVVHHGIPVHGLGVQGPGLGSPGPVHTQEEGPGCPGLEGQGQQGPSLALLRPWRGLLRGGGHSPEGL